MYDILEIAAYILKNEYCMPTMKLHKMCFLINKEYEKTTDEQLIEQTPEPGPTGPVYTKLLEKTNKSKKSRMLAYESEFKKLPHMCKLERTIADKIKNRYKDMTGAQMSAMFIATPELSNMCILPQSKNKKKKKKKYHNTCRTTGESPPVTAYIQNI